MSHDKPKLIPIRQEKSEEKIPIHLTARGKIAATVLAVTTVIGVGNAIHQANKVEFSDQTHTKVVSPGETVWDMANSVDGIDDHKREAVRKIEELSPDLQDGSADVGDEVIIPDSVE